MQTSVPELTDLSSEPQHVLDLYGPDVAQARHLRRQLPAGPAAGRARRAVRPALSTAAGTSTATCRSRSRGQCRDTDQPSAALVTRPEAARPARRHAGHLGRRVRPHGLLPGHADRRRTTAATIIRAASPSGWPAAASSRGITYGETDDFCYNIVEDPVHVHDLQRHDPALPGHRPHAADLPLPGPRLPADRRAWQCGQGIAGAELESRSQESEVKTATPAGFPVSFLWCSPRYIYSCL